MDAAAPGNACPQAPGEPRTDENAAAFGGDPGNVTLFGQSAGAASVRMNLVSPGAAGLSQRAITESGGCVAPEPDKTIAEHTGAALAARLGCADLICLRGKAPDELLAAVIGYRSRFAWTGNPNGPGLPSWPRLRPGDVVVPALARGRPQTVDLAAEHQCAFWAALAEGH